MILTVCPNPAVDKIILVDELHLGATHRVDRLIPCVGGKGLNSAVALHHLGVPLCSIGFFAGENGKELLKIIDAYGFRVEPIWVQGETRVSCVIVERHHPRHTHITIGNLRINDDDRRIFFERFTQKLAQAAYVIFGGSLPSGMGVGFYEEAINHAKAAGIPALIDAVGEPMLRAIKAKPEIVKMNRREFEGTFDCRAASFEDLCTQAKRVYEQLNIKNLVITLGAQGILTLTKAAIYHARCPAQEPLNAAGAGDAVSAVLAWYRAEGKGWLAALKMAAAVSAASVGTIRTADVDLARLEMLLDQVNVQKHENKSH